MIRIKILITTILITSTLGTISVEAVQSIQNNLMNTGVDLQVNQEEMKENKKETNLKESQMKMQMKNKTYPSSKTNRIGNEIQYNSSSCGPTTMYNVVYGYDVANYGKYCTIDKNGSLISSYGYASIVGYTPNGTPLGNKFKDALNRYVPNNNYVISWGKDRTSSDWINHIKNSIVYTSNKNNGSEKKNYPIVVNQYKRNNYSGIHPIYSGNSAHFLAAYGYGEYGNKTLISDSNPRLNKSNNKYTANTSILARDCKERGIIF